jgi:mono/diheme cytochrome c family protein
VALRLTPVAVLAAALLAGCGGGSKSSAPATSTAPPPPMPTTTSTTGVAGAHAGSQAVGLKVFKSHCSSCHTFTPAAATGTVGPDLDKLKLSIARVEAQVRHGGKLMPPFKGRLTDAQITAVSQAVSRAEGG